MRRADHQNRSSKSRKKARRAKGFRYSPKYVILDCPSGKVGYLTRHEAASAAKIQTTLPYFQRTAHQGEMQPYDCTNCLYWHTGHGR